jgi:uncharacterized RDD family membrane protein YckC
METGSPSPDRPRGPEAPGPDPRGPQAPPPAPPPAPPAPESPAGYGGPVPPGGWQQPIERPQGWARTPLAGWWSRVGATVVDALILTIPVILLVILVLAVFAGSDVAGIVVAIVAFFGYIAIALLYAPFLMKREGRHNGQTWGRQVLGIRVVRDNGQPVDFGFGLLREFVVKNLLFGVVGGFFASIPTLVDYLWPLWDDENRALHDMVVSSHVVQARD